MLQECGINFKIQSQVDVCILINEFLFKFVVVKNWTLFG